jgi:hypothetical protein
VLGGAGLVLLGLVGWLRWCCRNSSWAGGPRSGQRCPDADAA